MQWMHRGPCLLALLRAEKQQSHPCTSWEATLDFLLVNKVLDALEIPVPMHRADAELRHPCGYEKQPK